MTTSGCFILNKNFGIYVCACMCVFLHVCVFLCMFLYLCACVFVYVILCVERVCVFECERKRVYLKILFSYPWLIIISHQQVVSKALIINIINKKAYLDHMAESCHSWLTQPVMSSRNFTSHRTINK